MVATEADQLDAALERLRQTVRTAVSHRSSQTQLANVATKSTIAAGSSHGHTPDNGIQVVEKAASETPAPPAAETERSAGFTARHTDRRKEEAESPLSSSEAEVPSGLESSPSSSDFSSRAEEASNTSSTDANRPAGFFERGMAGREVAIPPTSLFGRMKQKMRSWFSSK